MATFIFKKNARKRRTVMASIDCFLVYHCNKKEKVYTNAQFETLRKIFLEGRICFQE
uniref:Uncharacterized protein n=1 Tax=Nelumbo nucifera TaxID=4432 RepID=A0A823A1P3_NELNU|nr:TPA_asm: hypothetical protein HUJ06_019156 [Nelumbo nucifera]